MSCLRLQPASSRTQAAPQSAASEREMEMVRTVLVIKHLGHVMRIDALQESRGVRKIEFLVAGLDAQKELVAGGVLGETLDVEQRMMRLRQAVQRQHAENRGKRRAQHGQFESDRNEGRPAIQGASRDVERIGVDVAPILEKKAAQSAAKAADQGDERDLAALEAQRFRQTCDWERRVGFEVFVARFAGLLRGGEQLVLGVELTQH